MIPGVDIMPLAEALPPRPAGVRMIPGVDIIPPLQAGLPPLPAGGGVMLRDQVVGPDPMEEEDDDAMAVEEHPL